MKITKRRLKRIIREERKKLFEDSVDNELDNLRDNIHNDVEHIRDLHDDIKDDHEEELKAEKDRSRKDESVLKISRKQLRKLVREIKESDRARSIMEDEGYDAREDESLGALYGAVGGDDFKGSHAEQEHSRRDDGDFERRLRNLERHHEKSQGYDDREDERLGAEHGSETHHEQDYDSRRDDAGFEARHENTFRGSQKLSRLQVRKIVREEKLRLLGK